MNLSNCLCLLICFPLINCEIFSSSTQLLKLLDTQKQLVDKIDELIRKRDDIFISLANLRNRLKEEDLRATLRGNAETYIENPINAFRLIKRFTVDIMQLKNALGIFNEEISGLAYPDNNDLVGSVEGIHRLQVIYLLKTRDLSDGILDTFGNSDPMSASDCLALGEVLLDQGQNYYSNEWFLESFRKSKDPYLADIRKRELLEYIAHKHYVMNDLEGSIKWQTEIEKEFPEDENNKHRMDMCHHALSERKTGEEAGAHENSWSQDELTSLQTYADLCQGVIQLSANWTKRYKTIVYTAVRNLRSGIGGLSKTTVRGGVVRVRTVDEKMEEIFLDPEILVYHDVISDDEINHFATLGLEGLYRCQIGKYDTELGADPARVCQGSWLPDYTDDVVRNVANRASRIAGLSLVNSEDFQFVTYTAGGHYDAHLDMSTSQEGGRLPFDVHVGNRIATLIFYLKDVPRGGGTVFPKQGVGVQPARGTAIVWRNLLPSTEPDTRTLHGACPLIQGPKWILTKWFHQVGQELIAPCNLEYQPEEISEM